VKEQKGGRKALDLKLKMRLLKTKRPLNNREVKLLTTFAEQAAIAIQNTRLYDNLSVHIQKLQDAQAQLIQSEKLAAIGRLVANVAHEINNPLTGMLMASSLILEQIDDKDPHKLELETIKRETLRTRGIVKNLLDFARQSEGNIEKLDINSVVQSSVTLLQRQINQRGIEFIEDYANSVPKVRLDRNQMMQVFYNLIINALDAMPQGGSLTIRTRVEDKNIVIEFTDTGVGIPPENLEKLFEPFFTTKPHTQGIGLGLSISYSIVSQFGGNIKVKSKPRKGSTFSVII